MAVSRIGVLCAGLVAGAYALSAWAASGSDGASCVAVNDDMARLACYDRAFGRKAASSTEAAVAVAAAAGTAATAPSAARVPVAPTSAPPVRVAPTDATPVPVVPEDPVAEFGLTEAAKQAKDPAKAAEAAKAPTSVTAKVISVRFRKYGEFVVTLDNGQVWEQNDPMSSAVVRVGDTVTVKKAVLGSYTLVTAARVATKVHRVD
jgi:hypothetical protein